MVAPAPNINNQIGTFKAAFKGGTRPNRFSVSDDGSIIGGNPLLVKAASMPVQTVGILQIPYRGRGAKLPGDRTYAEWTITIIDDTKSGNLRKKFEKWHNKFNDHVTNTVKPKVLRGDGKFYMQWRVDQLDMTGGVIRSNCLQNCWPVELGAVELSYDTADTLTEYQVTLAYDYLDPECGGNDEDDDDGGDDGGDDGEEQTNDVGQTVRV